MQHPIRIGLAVLAMLLSTGPAFAQNQPPVAALPPLFRHRQLILNRLRAEAAIIAGAMNCVEGAANDEGLRVCMAERRIQEQTLARQERLR